jgi:hypothetical protein
MVSIPSAIMMAPDLFSAADLKSQGVYAMNNRRSRTIHQRCRSKKKIYSSCKRQLRYVESHFVPTSLGGEGVGARQVTHLIRACFSLSLFCACFFSGSSNPHISFATLHVVSADHEVNLNITNKKASTSWLKVMPCLLNKNIADTSLKG